MRSTPAGARSRWWSRTAATGRSRSARTTTSPRPTRALRFDRAAARGMRLNIAVGHRGALRARPAAHGRTGRLRRRPPGLRLPRPGARSTLMATIATTRLCRDVRPHRRRPRAPGRHRADHRGRAATTRCAPAATAKRSSSAAARPSATAWARASASTAPARDEAVDCVITNALIIDHWGIVKADIGIRGQRIAAIGKAGNPDVQPGVDIVIGPGTEIIAGRRHDRHRRRHRLPHPLHLPAADRRGAGQRRDHDARRRHRPGHRHLRHHLHARARRTSRACCRRPTPSR